MRRLLLLALFLLCCVPLEAQDFRHRYFHYNQKFTPDLFTITAMTQDGVDTARISIGGGGDLAGTRGARLDLYGSDRGGAGLGGDILLNAGDAGDIILAFYDTGDLIFRGVGAGGYIDFETNGQQKWFIPPTAAAESELYYGIVGTANWTANVLNSSSDGADSGRLTLSGGGAVGNTRGGRIDIYGADRGGAGLGGDILLFSADSGDIEFHTVNNGDINVDSGGAGSYINFTTTGFQKWFIPPAAATTSDWMFGSGNTQYSGLIAAATADANDVSALTVTGGGFGSTTRGGYITLQGADYGGAGLGGGVTISAADNGDIIIDAPGATGYIDFKTNGTQHWFISPNGSLYSDPANGGNLVFERDGYGITEKSDILAVAGNSQATAAAVVHRVTFVTGADGVAGRGVRLPATPAAGDCYRLFNAGNNTFQLYPGAGDTLNLAAADTPATISNVSTAVCCANSASQWFCYEAPAT